MDGCQRESWSTIWAGTELVSLHIKPKVRQVESAEVAPSRHVHCIMRTELHLQPRMLLVCVGALQQEQEIGVPQLPHAQDDNHLVDVIWHALNWTGSDD